jgi:hypothetical protein
MNFLQFFLNFVEIFGNFVSIKSTVHECRVLLALGTLWDPHLI